MERVDFPRVRLAHLPTPLEPLAGLRRALGASQELFIKRDDCTGLGFGGNKTRKLEFSLAAALAAGADCLVTTGGLQSNHVRQTAAAAARLGLECHAVVANTLGRQDATYTASGNVLLDHLFGAHVHLAEDDDAASAEADRLVASLQAEGRRPFRVPLGASDGRGAMGYVLAAEELLGQCSAQGIKPTHIVLCTGSAGTHAGLLAGLIEAGSSAKVIGVSSSEPSAVKIAKVAGVIREIYALWGREAPDLTGLIDVRDAYVGEGYAHLTEAANAAVRLVASAEGILLDPVYTAKAMAGLIDMLDGEIPASASVVFLHTGGAPALYAYLDALGPKVG